MFRRILNLTDIVQLGLISVISFTYEVSVEGSCQN